MIECEVKTKNGYERRYAHSINELNLSLCEKIKSNKNSKYCDVFATFDIEATSDTKGYPDITPSGFMYHWQMCIGGIVVFGRHWSEFLALLDKLKFYFNLFNKKMVIYVHNLSYEFVFMYNFVKCMDIFATDRNKILKCANDCFEFRCSYRLTNMSLEKFIENSMEPYYLKSSDDLDYRVYRTPFTPLTPKEYGYCFNDVKGLYDALLDFFSEDTLDSIPLTSTGFVRRDCRNAMRKNKRNRKLFKDMALSLDDYILCKDAFRGGDVHGSRYYVNQELENVYSFDKASSYPYVMYCLPEFPMSKFMEYTVDDLNDLEKMNEKYCTIGRYQFKNIRLKTGKTNPYIPFAKCQSCYNPKLFNGRVLESEYIEIALTNIDVVIILEDYDFEEMGILTFKFARKGFLPKELRDVVWFYFGKKTNLKGIAEKAYEYMKSKNKLNSIFGMMVTDILHSVLEFNGIEYTEKESDPEELLKKYYKSRNSFLSYQWGVWVTALARKELRKGINAVGLDNVYNDTDSVKCLGDYTKVFEQLNKDIINNAKENSIVNYIDREGKRFYLGTWDIDGHYTEFKTLGSKKYVYRENGKLNLTVAGLNKKKGANYLESIGGIPQFKKGLIFTDSGRTSSYYNYTQEIKIVNDNGFCYQTSSNIAIVEVDYTLGITDTMLSILNEIRLVKSV